MRYGENLAPIHAAIAALALSGCSSLGDLGYVDHPAVADNIHAWVGQEAAAHVGAPISFANLTEDERTLRDQAFPLMQPAYTRGLAGGVEFSALPERLGPIWGWIAVHPSGYREEIMGFHSPAGAVEWRGSNRINAWFRSRGYIIDDLS
jgi:hypothetical protein